jgi:hypothetical protein
MTTQQAVERMRGVMAAWNRARHINGINRETQDALDADLHALSTLIDATMQINNERLSRVTVVDESGRVYERRNLDVRLSLQDEGRTLKVFVNPR